jgi:hypothetical protein
MASTISAGTSAGTAIAIAGDTSGNLAFQTQAGANTITVPNATGTMMVSGNMPAFSVYLTAAQTITNAAFVKLAFDTKLFDTANAFNTTTNRFQPTIAGYYQMNGGFYLATPTTVLSSIEVNGFEYSRGVQFSGNGQSAYVSSLVYLNGTTDYAELFVYQSAGISQAVNTASFLTYFNGSLVRTA